MSATFFKKTGFDEAMSGYTNPKADSSSILGNKEKPDVNNEKNIKPVEETNTTPSPRP